MGPSHSLCVSRRAPWSGRRSCLLNYVLGYRKHSRRVYCTSSVSRPSLSSSFPFCSPSISIVSLLFSCHRCLCDFMYLLNLGAPARENMRYLSSRDWLNHSVQSSLALLFSCKWLVAPRVWEELLRVCRSRCHSWACAAGCLGWFCAYLSWTARQWHPGVLVSLWYADLESLGSGIAGSCGRSNLIFGVFFKVTLSKIPGQFSLYYS